MKRILVTGLQPYANGVATSMLNLFRHIDRDRIRMDFLLQSRFQKLEPKDSHQEEIEALGGHVYWANHVRDAFPSYSRTVFKRILDDHPEIAGVHMCAYEMHTVFPIWQAHLRRLPVRIIHCHAGRETGFSEKPDASTRACRHRIAGDNADRWACSDNAGQFLYGDLPFMIFPNAIDTERFRYSPVYRKAIRRSLRIPDRIPVFGMMGVMSQRKNHIFAMHVFKAFQEHFPESVFLIVGSGKLYPKIRECAEKLDLTPSIRFTGLQTDTEMFYSAMDVLLMPSLSEGFPNVLTEAQSNGLPCLVSDRITEMTALTPLVHFLPLPDKDLPKEDAVRSWTKETIQRIREKRHSHDLEVKAAGFDIRDSAKWLTEYYCAKIAGKKDIGSYFSSR